MQLKQCSGFSLIELMIAVAIIGLISLVAIPAYENQVTKSRRIDGQASLMELATRMERYFTQNNSYAGSTMANVGMATASPEKELPLPVMPS